MTLPNRRIDINSVTKYIYYVLIASLLLFAVISIGSYLSVYMTFGKVPSSQDFTAELIGTSGKRFRIFPINAGGTIFVIYGISQLLSYAFIPLMLVLSYTEAHIKLHKRLFISLVILNIIFIVVASNWEILFWYSQYILD